MKITQNTIALPYKTFRFSGGETHFRLEAAPQAGSPVRILTRIRGGDDVMLLLLAVDALERAGVPSSLMTLSLPYLPYARQDRVMTSGESFSLKVFSRLINSLEVAQVEVFDPHSDVGPALLDRCLPIANTAAAADYIRACVKSPRAILVSPDAGAYKKTSKLADLLGLDVVVATKSRSVTDGRLAPPHVLGDVSGRTCIIVDDICDGGRTFINLADALKEAGAAECHLFVSHGIFSQGYDALFERFASIGTTDSFQPAAEYPANIHLIPITE
ncbi:MAG: hypothetical protein RIS79_1234 [Verrucomicrobiota bacterium]|jgi:ribose-phosphate pyrophosphokinase